MGTLGLDSWGGWISMAYNTKLEWPGVEPLYSRMWRSDPEVTITRTWLQAMSGKLRLEWVLPEERDGRALGEPTDDDKRALEFAQSLGADVAGGLGRWIASCNARNIFYGWAWWELPLGIRRQGWSPPGDAEWESEYDDGLVGLRGIHFRDYSSFMRWDISDETGRVMGMEQHDPPNQPVTIPRERSLHATYGDHDNPEGLATLESLWRLERLLYGYEVVHGIGSEHAAGHVNFTVSQKLDDETKEALRRAARALSSAVEGNYGVDMVDKEGNPIYTSKIIDVDFSAGEAILNAIKHIRLVKLQLFGMQWAAMATTADTGAYSAVQDASGMALLLFNALSESNVQQASEQIGRRIFDHPVNRETFPNMTRRPELVVNDVRKTAELGTLGAFAQQLGQLVRLGRDDEIAIRRESGFLPETPGVEQEDPMEDDAAPDDGPAPERDGPRRSAPENIDAETGLNGAQITAVLTVLDNMANRVIAPSVAVELLIAVGIEPGRSAQIIRDQVEGGGNIVQPGDGDMPEPNQEPEQPEEQPDEGAPGGEGGESPAEMQRPIVPEQDEEPVSVRDLADVTEEDVTKAVSRFRRWAEKEAPELARLLDARVEDSGEEEEA
jgi:hypothetical protein